MANGQFIETNIDARREDKKRAKRLLKSHLRQDHGFGDWLKHATSERALPLSLAAAFYWRVVRRKLPALLIKACRRDSEVDAVLAFTVIFEKQRLAAGQLQDASAAHWKAQFRNVLASVGIEAADGILFACLHGSFDGEEWEPHWHGFAAGGKAQLFELLRKHPNLQPSFLLKKPITTRSIAIHNIPDLLAWITYCLQRWWPWKPCWIDAHGKRRRGRRRRLEPREDCEFLSWIATQNLGDLILLMGLRMSDLTKIGGGQ